MFERSSNHNVRKRAAAAIMVVATLAACTSRHMAKAPAKNPTSTAAATPSPDAYREADIAHLSSADRGYRYLELGQRFNKGVIQLALKNPGSANVLCGDHRTGVEIGYTDPRLGDGQVSRWSECRIVLDDRTTDSRFVADYYAGGDYTAGIGEPSPLAYQLVKWSDPGTTGYPIEFSTVGELPVDGSTSNSNSCYNIVGLDFTDAGTFGPRRDDVLNYWSIITTEASKIPVPASNFDAFVTDESLDFSMSPNQLEAADRLAQTCLQGAMAHDFRP